MVAGEHNMPCALKIKTIELILFEFNRENTDMKVKELLNFW